MRTKKLRISFYTDTYLPAVDGVVRSISDFKRELEERGNTVYLITSGNAETKRIASREKNVIVTPSIKFKKYPQYSLSILPFMEIAKTRNADADIVHVHTPFVMGIYGIMSGRMRSVPVIWTFHTMFTNRDAINQYAPGNTMFKKLVMKHSWSYVKFIANRCDAVIAPTETIRKKLYGAGIRNVVVVPNGVNLKRFKREKSTALRRKLLKGDKWMVLYVGRLSKEKNIDTLISAAKILKEKRIKFVIVGDGPYAAHVKNRVLKLGLEDRFVFAGKITKGLVRYYNAADLLCLPSTFETQGIVCIESMACGTPVVGADYLALKEIIRNGKNGEKFRPKDPKDCARKIEKVINNVRSYRDCESTANRYSIKVATDQLLSLYGDLIEKRSRNKTKGR